MNILIEDYVSLRILWKYLGYKFNLFNPKIITVVALLVYISLLANITPVTNVYENEINYQNYDTYKELTITKEDKIDTILEKYNLSKEEFRVLSAIVLSEAEGNSYDDAYAVINTIYNRTHAKNWVRSVNGHFGKGKGNNLYYQAISPGQFTVYKSGSYKRHLNDTKSVGYDAIIDFLYSEDIMHNYLSFRSHSIKIKGSESYSKHGNNYFSVLNEKNRI